LPLLLLGARQVGKTFILKQFARENYKDVIYINFENNSNKKVMFDKDLDPKRIIEEIELDILKKIIPEETLIIFDEIQQVPRAITSLKYFNEQLPQYNIACAGSLLGVMLFRENVSFPVGKVEFEYLYPFTFDEFLVGTGRNLLKTKIESCFKHNKKMPEMIHQQLIDLYKKYLCIGGMPAAINNYKENKESLIEFDQNIHENILNAYIVDMGKYCSGSETLKVQAIYKSMPNQLAKENKKFKYSVVKKGSKSSQYEGAIEWLLSSRINLVCKCINNPDFPLSAYHEKNIFKLYMSDVGLLNKLSKMPYKIIIENEHHLFKGAIAENYVATELKSNNFELYYYKRNASEVDFVVELNGEIIPIEVKAHNNTRSRSLNMYIERYKPSYAIRISTKNFGFNNGIKSIPLYSVYCLKK
jgi:predicted AAA+ superfamily ATPase